MRAINYNEDAKRLMLHYASRGDAYDEDSELSVLRSIMRPLSQASFFEVNPQVDHRWPSFNLLNDRGHCSVRYESSAHLVMSSNRLLVVRPNSHFYFPPVSGSIQDAYIQRCDLDRHSVLFIGLAAGFHAALLKESPPAVLYHAFIPTDKPVEKIISLESGMLTLCYGDAGVESFRVTIVREEALDIVPSSSHGPRKVLDCLSSLWGSKRYQDSAYDSFRGSLFVLSRADLTMWKRTPACEFVAVSSVTVGGNIAFVLISTEPSFHAVLVTSDGGRQPVAVEEGVSVACGAKSTKIRLGSARPLPPGLHFGDIRFVCRNKSGTTLLYDAWTSLLILITTGSPVYEGIFDDVEIVSTFQINETVVGLACISESIRGRSSFVVYGGSGIICSIDALSTGLVTANFLQPQNKLGEAMGLIRKLGCIRGMEAVVGSCLTGVPPDALAPLLGEFMCPSFNGNSAQVAPGVEGLFRLIRVQAAEAERLWAAPFSWELVFCLEDVVRHMEEWHSTVESLLSFNGLLDCPNEEGGLVWQEHTVSSSQRFTMRTALNAQASVLLALLNGLRDMCIICRLYRMLLVAYGAEAANIPLSMGERTSLQHVVWGCNSDTIISELCEIVLARSVDTTLPQLQVMERALPTKAQHAINIHLLAVRGDADAALSYAFENIKSLRNEQMMDYVKEKLDTAFPDHMVPMKLLLCWLRHEKSSIGELLSTLERCTVNGPPELVKRCLRLVMHSVEDDSALFRAVVRWIVGHALEDSRLICFAEVMEEHAVKLGEPRTLPELFFLSWTCRLRRPQTAARGFSDIARSKQRVSLSTRILCINLALEYGSADSDRLTYVLLLLQDELVKIIERETRTDDSYDLTKLPKLEVGSHVDELRHFCVVTSRLFELAGMYRDAGGAKVQMDILKMHSDTPERVTVEVLHNLLTSLVHNKGLSASEAVRHVVREYYGGYAAGLPLLPFVIFLAHSGENPRTIVEVLQSGGVSGAIVFDTFLHCLDDRCDDAIFTKGGVVSALAAAVANVVGEGSKVYATYLLERINKLLESEHQVALLQDIDVEQLRSAEAAMMRFVSSSQSVS